MEYINGYQFKLCTSFSLPGSFENTVYMPHLSEKFPAKLPPPKKKKIIIIIHLSVTQSLYEKRLDLMHIGSDVKRCYLLWGWGVGWAGWRGVGGGSGDYCNLTSCQPHRVIDLRSICRLRRGTKETQ